MKQVVTTTTAAAAATFIIISDLIRFKFFGHNIKVLHCLHISSY